MKNTIIKEAQESVQNLLYKAQAKNWKNGGVAIYDLKELQEASDRVIEKSITTAYNSRQSEIDAAREEGRYEIQKRVALNIGFLRQWLNENRITGTNRMVTDEQLDTMIVELGTHDED